tara:strand:+ start:91 stop:237 length:147 start_codon:yes stop_codon:yes gene_type:complete
MLFREDDKRELALALDAGEGKRKKKVVKKVKEEGRMNTRLNSYLRVKK